MKVMGESRPCQSPFQNPATFPCGEGDFSTGFGPGRQLVREKISAMIKNEADRIFIFYSDRLIDFYSY